MPDDRSSQIVLIVDDDPRNIRILEELLGETYMLLTAHNGQQAIEILNKRRVDTVLLDVMMPGLSGYEVCQKIRSERRFDTLKIILVTGRAMPEDERTGIRCGANAYITKPFDFDELERIVKEGADQHEMQLPFTRIFI